MLHHDAAVRLRSDWLLRPFGHHAAARRERRGDEQGCIAFVGKVEDVFRVAVLHDGVEVEHRFLKGDFGRGGLLCRHSKCGCKDYRSYDDGFLHGLHLFVLLLIVFFGFKEFGVVAQRVGTPDDFLPWRDEIV